MITPSLVKRFTMKEKIGNAPSYVREYIAFNLCQARIELPRSIWRAYHIGLARGKAIEWSIGHGA